MTKYRRYCMNCGKDFFCNGKCKDTRIIYCPTDCYCPKCAKKLTRGDNITYNVLQFNCAESGREEVHFT